MANQIQPSTLKTHIPLIGLIASGGLLEVAAARYPGGSTFDKHSVGFAWTRNFISALFQPLALNGAANSARIPAVLAMLALCLSLGYAFWRISRAAASARHRKFIETGGIGSMVYGFLVVTPLHNLMVNIALLFYLTAVLTIMYGLYIQRTTRLLMIGVACNVVLLLSAVIYYGNVLYWMLPTMQKLTYASCSCWIMAVYYNSLKTPATEVGLG